MGIDISGFLTRHGGKATATVALTNLIIRFESSDLNISGVSMYEETRSAASYIANNEDLIVTLDKETLLYKRGSSITFTPVYFANGYYGFRIVRSAFPHDMWEGYFEVSYITLGDTPVEVGEENVRLVIEKGKWTRFEDATPAKRHPIADILIADIRARKAFLEALAATNSNVHVVASEAIGDETETVKRSSVWVYAGVGVVLCLGAILYAVRKKPKR